MRPLTGDLRERSGPAPATVGMPRVLAVPVLGERGGGVGQVSALLWDVMGEAWPDERQMIALLQNGDVVPDTLDKIRFGGQLAVRQAIGGAKWILFTHLGLSRVESWVPGVLRAPYGVFLHGIEAWQPLSAGTLRLINRAAIRLANSDLTVRKMRALNPGVADVVVCPLALPRGERDDTANRTRQADRPPIVLVVGRMSDTERYKGHDELIDVWPDVTTAVRDARLIIVGDGSDRPRLEARARASRAGDRMLFTGFVDRQSLMRWYDEAAVFAMPSRGEGFGLVYLEAMAHGLPCIASAQDAGREVVADGHTGLVIDPDDRPALGRAIVTLLTDAALRERMGQCGQQRLREHFTFERFSRRLVPVLAQAFREVTG